MSSNISIGIPVRVNEKLPFKPSPDDIIYVENGHTIKVERWRIEYYRTLIKEMLNVPDNYVNGYFELIIQILNNPTFWTYTTEEYRNNLKIEIIDKFDFCQYIDSNHIMYDTGIYIYESAVGEKYRFRRFELETEGLWATLEEAFTYMDKRDYKYGLEYEQYSNILENRDEVIKQLQECVSKLEQMGFNEKDIHKVMHNDIKLYPLEIVNDNKLILITKEFVGKMKKREVQEIKLSPLDKAVYLLFLKHPEGINFSYLPDYRDELFEIYKSLMNYRTTAAMRRSIDDVTNPLSNSINEKCARIRRAFVNELGEYLADYYTITGKRGEIKKIILDRNLVTWNQEIDTINFNTQNTNLSMPT